MWINLENYNVLLRTRGAYRRKRQRTLCSLWHFICLKTFLIRLLSLYSGAFCFLKLPSCETVNSTKWLWEKMYILYFGINFAQWTKDLIIESPDEMVFDFRKKVFCEKQIKNSTCYCDVKIIALKFEQKIELNLFWNKF